MHGQNLLLFFSISFQNAYFMTTVPIYFIKHAFSKRFQFYDGLLLMFLHRANFEIFGNKNPEGNSLLKCMDEIHGCYAPQKI